MFILDTTIAHSSPAVTKQMPSIFMSIPCKALRFELSGRCRERNEKRRIDTGSPPERVRVHGLQRR